MKKVKVIVPILNVRNQMPGVRDDNYIGYLPEGAELFVESQQTIDVNGEAELWYKDQYNRYYLGKGLRELRPVDLAADPRTAILNYNLQWGNLPEEWLIAGGRNIKVAVLDSGFNIRHKDIKNSILDVFNAVDLSKDVSSGRDHGDNVSGLIAGSAGGTNGVVGVAPQARLLLIKIADSNGVIMPAFVKQGLAHALNEEADVINISLSLNDEDYLPLRNDFLELFELARQKRTLIVASAGENSGLLNNRPSVLLPANEEACLAIGTVNARFVANNPAPLFNKRVDYLMPNLSLMSCAAIEDAYSTVSDSSMAAAMLSGVAALFLSHAKSRKSKEELIAGLNNFLPSFTASASLSNLSIFKP